MKWIKVIKLLVLYNFHRDDTKPHEEIIHHQLKTGHKQDLKYNVETHEHTEQKNQDYMDHVNVKYITSCKIIL